MILEMKYKCGCVMTRERENKPFVEKSTCAEHYTQRTHAGRADREYAERIDAQLSSAARTGRDEFAPHAYQEERGNPFCKVCGCTEQYGKHLSKSDIAALAAKELGLPHTDMPLPPIDSLLMGKKVPELAKDWPIHTLCEPGSLLAYVVQPDEPNGMLTKEQAPREIPTRKVFVPVQMDEMPGKPHVMREIEIPDENADVAKPQAPGYNTFEVGRASFYACEGGQECAEGRDHPGRWFVCHTGLDDNIAEVFAWNGRSAEQNAGDIARALNNQCTREFEANGGPKSGTMVHASTEDIMDPVEAVPIPRSARHAEMMQKVGYSWLETHAPERLTKAMQDNIKLSVEARMNNPKFGPPQDEREWLAVRNADPIAKAAFVRERDGEWREALYRTLTECDQRWGTKLLQSVEVGSAGPSVTSLMSLMLAAWQSGRDDCVKKITDKLNEVTRL